MKKEITMFLVISALAAFLRFWQLGLVPASPDWDEVSLGYNAYSVMKTGRDEYGTFMPAVLRSFDDYKPPLYMYLTIPSIAVFGLNVWAVRLPSAIMGTLAVIGTYFLVKEFILLIDGKRRSKLRYMPLLSMGLMAVSPWNIHFSRIAFEANAGIFLNIWFLVFFFSGLRNHKYLSLSAIFASLALYAYHSERVFIPLMLIILAVLFRNKLAALKSKLIIPLFLGFVIIIPLIVVFTNPVSWTRLKGTSVLSDQTRLLERSVNKLIDDRTRNDKFGQIFDNRRIVYIQKIADGYLSHFSVRWLFLTGDNERHQAPDMGLVYLIELPFLLYGLYQVGRTGGIFSRLLILWVLISPIAASPTSQTPHAIRTMVVLPSLQIITSFGILNLLDKVRNRLSRGYVPVILLILIFYIFSISYYLHMYYGHMNREYSINWQYGYKEAVDVAKQEYDKVDKIVVSPKLEQPYIFFLFYLKYPPEKYLAEGGTKSGGFAEYRNKFDKYVFRNIDASKEVFDGKTLYIGPPSEVSGNYFKTIYYLDGTAAINIAK